MNKTQRVTRGTINSGILLEDDGIVRVVAVVTIVVVPVPVLSGAVVVDGREVEPEPAEDADVGSVVGTVVVLVNVVEVVVVVVGVVEDVVLAVVEVVVVGLVVVTVVVVRVVVVVGAGAGKRAAVRQEPTVALAISYRGAST